MSAKRSAAGGASIRKADLHAAIVVVAIAVGCHSYAESTPWRRLDDPAENYKRVFGRSVPKEIEIIHSVVIDYAWRPGVVTTDDWAFEVIAPRSWIDKQIRRLGLGAREDTWGFEDLIRREQSGLPDWYAPQGLDGYDGYVSRYTSIPYVHMLVSKDAEPDMRYRVFARKR